MRSFSTTTVTGPTGGANAALVTSGACTGDEGVTIIVDASALDDSEPQAQCFLTDETVPASDALTVAQIETEIVSAAPVQAGGGYTLHFSQYNGGRAEIRTAPDTEPVTGVKWKAMR